MANPDDLERALSGDKDLEDADLTGANLKDADLTGANLYDADLSRANLKDADLTGANLEDAFLKRANLEDAKLIRANLEDAFLSGANLTNAKLIRADLSYANLTSANLTGADLTGATLYQTDLLGADLTGAKGIPLSISDKFSHEGETIEEGLRREKEERLRREEEERPRREEAIQDITKRVSRAKSDKELEALAQEVGSLQAQPEYVHEYRKDLEKLQAGIERKYSLVGKGLRYLKRLFNKGKRASQIRIASEMNRELQREIRALKRDLDK